MKSTKIHLIDIFLFAAALAVLAFAVFGKVVKKAELPGRTEITISAQCEYFFGKETTASLIQEFERQNPDLRILTVNSDADIVFFDGGEFANPDSVPDNNGSDNGVSDNSVNDNDAAVPALASLSPYIHSETGTEQHAVPLVFFTDLLFYNIDILAAANSVRPPKTRTEFLATAKAVAAGIGKNENSGEAVYGFALGLSPDDPLAVRREIYPWIWAEGGEVIADSAGAVEEVTLSKTAEGTIAFFGRLNSEGVLAPGTFEKTSTQRLEEFAEGKIAMLTASARDIPFLRQNASGIRFGITSVPATTAFGKNRMGLSGIFAGISSGCTLQDEAWAFLAFVSGKKNTLAAALEAVPGIHSGVIPGEYINEDPLYSKAWELFEAADIIEFSPHQTGEKEISRTVWKKLAEMLIKAP